MTTRREFLKLGAAASFSTAFLPREIYAKYESDAETSGNDVVLRCCIMSDVHFNGSPTAKEVPRFRRAIDLTYKYSSDQPYKNFDALLVIGDMTNHGTEDQIGLFKKEMDAALKPGTDAFVCMGNHEYYGGNRELWESVFGVKWNDRYERNGYQFIAISPEHGRSEDGAYLYVIDYLEKELEAAYQAGPEKPIFVFQHIPPEPTVYGSRAPDDWGAKDLFDTLQKYPTVVNFSGHTHTPINDPRNAWQGNFTAFGAGTLSYMCHGEEGGRFWVTVPDDQKYAQFLIMEVRRDHSIVLKLFDLTTDSFFDQVFYVGKAGAIDSYVYTDDRFANSELPTWREGTELKINVEDSYFASVEFVQAACRDVVLGYRVDIERFDASADKWVDDPAQYFWSQYFLRDMPEIARGSLSLQEPNTKYRIKITAISTFLRESETTLDGEFTTPSDASAEDKNAAAPKGNFYDAKVVDGEFVNTALCAWGAQKTLAKHGAPKIVKDPEIGADVVEFNGVDQFYRSECSDSDYRRLRRATIFARFKYDEAPTHSNAIFGNTQGSGIEIYYDVGKKVLELWACVNSQYVVLAAPIEMGEYCSACGTFDGQTVVFYINGKEVAREERKGALTHPSHADVRAFCFGSDVASWGGELFFKGRLESAKLYTWALSAEQVANISR